MESVGSSDGPVITRVTSLKDTKQQQPVVSNSDDEIQVTQVVTRSVTTDAGGSGPSKGPAGSTGTATSSLQSTAAQNNNSSNGRTQRRQVVLLPQKIPTRAEVLEKIEAKKKQQREATARRRAAMTPEQRAEYRLKACIKKREGRRKEGCSTIKNHSKLYRPAPVVLPEVFQPEINIFNQIRYRIRNALETPSDREKRLEALRAAGRIKNRKGLGLGPETPDERELREILVRKAFAVEIGKEEEMNQFEIEREQYLRLELKVIMERIKNLDKPKKTAYGHSSRISKTDREILQFWENKKVYELEDIISFGDGVIPSDDDDEEGDEDSCEEEEAEGNQINESSREGLVEETEAEWSARVSDIFNTRPQDKNQNCQNIPQDKSTKQSPPKESQVKEGTTAKSTSTVELPDYTEYLESTLSRKEYLTSIISVEKAERVVIVEAEIAERRAVLAGETEDERKTRLETLLGDANRAAEITKAGNALRFQKRKARKNALKQVGTENGNGASTPVEEPPGGRRRKKKVLTEEELKADKERKAEYMRRQYDLWRVEWETWIGLRDASAPPGLCEVTSEVTGVVNAQGALDWLEENKEDHRWGITTGAAIKLTHKVPAAVKKYRLSLATLIDDDEKRSGPNAKRVAKETLLQLLTTERNILEEYFYRRKTYVQTTVANSAKKKTRSLEQLAEIRARQNEKLRERYRAQRLREGKTYDPERRGPRIIKDKETLLKELKGEIPRSTRGITKTKPWERRGGFSWRRKTVVERDGRALPISTVLLNKPPGEREIKDIVNNNDSRTAVDIEVPQATSLNTITTDHTTLPSTICDNPTSNVPDQPSLVSISAVETEQSDALLSKQTPRSPRKRHEETPPPSPSSDPEVEDSDSDWAPADVDESLFDDDDSRGGVTSVENTATPPVSQETWNNPPVLEPYSTINQSHLYPQSMFSNASFSTGEQRSFQAFPPPVNTGPEVLLGNSAPVFPTAASLPAQQQNSSQFHSVPNADTEITIPVLSSCQAYTASYASSECSEDIGPPTLTAEDDSSSIPDAPPPQKRRRGRPPSSVSSAKKVVKSATYPTQTRTRKSRAKPELIKVSSSLLRPQTISSEGKLPIVALPGLLIGLPENPSQESNDVEPTVAVVTTTEAPAIPSDDQKASLSVPDIPKGTSEPREQDSNLKCSKRTETFDSDEKLEAHQTEKHSNLENCQEIKEAEKKVVLEESGNEEKLKSNTKLVAFKCPLCETELRDSKIGVTFTNHLWTTHWKDEMKCDLGPCPICRINVRGQGARYFYYLTKHFNRYHADVRKTTFIPGLQGAAAKTKNYSFEKFSCIICSSTFSSYLNLAKHIENGHSRACQVCGIILQVQDHLKNHVQIFHPQETYTPQEILSEDNVKKQVQCAKCRSKFISSDHLKSHEEICEEKEGKLAEQKCWWNCSKSKDFKSLDALEKHHDENHEQDTVVPAESCRNLHLLYKCELCSSRKNSLPVLRLHYMKQHASAPPIPEVDPPEPEEELKAPAKVQTIQLNLLPNINRNRVKAVAAEFPEFQRANSYKLQAEPEGPAYTCGECPKELTAGQFCLLHRGYTKTRRRCCRICGAQFPSIVYLILHNKTKHGVSVEENSRLEKEYEEQRLQAAQEKNEPLLKCAMCSKKFVAKDFHIMHSAMGDVLDPDRKACPHCPNVSFYLQTALDKHINLCHSDEKTAAETVKKIEEANERRRKKPRKVPEEQDWPCQICGSIFTLKGSLQRHMKNTHSALGKKFQCPHCEHKVSRLEHLRNHIKSVHLAGRTFRVRPKTARVHIPDKKCPQCTKKFATENRLQNHIEKFHGPETLCYACGETFKDIKAHNKVCEMGGVEEDAIIKDKHTKPDTTKSTKVQKTTRLSLLALLRIARENYEKVFETPLAKIKKGPSAKVETSDDDDDDDEIESDLDERDSKTRISRLKESRSERLRKRKYKKKSKEDEQTESDFTDLDERESKTRITRLKKESNSEKSRSSKYKKKSKEDSHSHKKQKKHKRNKEKKSTKEERPKRRGRKKKMKSDSDDEKSDNETDRNWEDDDNNDNERIEIKEEVDDVLYDDEMALNVEVDLDGLEIQPDEASCSVTDCPCEGGKWSEIVHSDREIVVPLVRCDREVQIILERRRQIAEIELKRKEAEEELDRERQKLIDEQVEMEKEDEQKAELAASKRRQSGRSKPQSYEEKLRKKAAYERERRRRHRLGIQSETTRVRKLAVTPTELTEVEIQLELERKKRRAEYDRERRRKLRMRNKSRTAYDETDDDDDQSTEGYRSESKSPDPNSVEGWTRLNHIILSNCDALDSDSSSDEEIGPDPLAF